jgi:ubiquinone/menaquinone biosynthesis C-methylase UbiE
VRKWLTGFLKNKSNLRVLEINCGTGDDAIWLASMGHRVMATDISEAMVFAAKTKLLLNKINLPVQFVQSAFIDLSGVLQGEKFDLIFSNFSGLNCVKADELAILNNQFYQLLKPGGHMAAVIFGKYNWWETIYFLSKFKWSKAFRRWKKEPSSSQLKEGIFQPVYYYSIRRFRRLLGHLRMVEKRPVGLFIPPSYLEPVLQKNTRLFHFLEKAEMTAGGIASFSQLADHSYLLLKKE